ncbi:MAG: hypothetical protein AB7V27_07040 [Candidatus Binatia bacterium]
MTTGWIPYPRPLHLGFAPGRYFALRFLLGSRSAGIHQVILSFKFGTHDALDLTGM